MIFKKVSESDLYKYSDVIKKDGLFLKRSGSGPSLGEIVCYEAWINGEVAGFRIADIHEDGMGIYLRKGFTFPKFRKQKIYSELTRHILNKINPRDNIFIYIATPTRLDSHEFLKPRFIKMGFKFYRMDGDVEIYISKYGDLKI